QDLLHGLQRKHAILEAVDRPAQLGDMVSISFHKKGHPENRDHVDVYLEQAPYASEMISKIVESLIGRKKGEEFEIALDFSLDEGNSVTVDTVVHVEEVQAATLPSFDELLSEFSLDSLEDLRQIVYESIAKNKENKYAMKYITQVIDTLRERTRFAYSPILLEQEVQAMLKESEDSLSQQGLSMETFLEKQGLTHEEFIEKRIRPEAKRRLERVLLLERIFSEEQLEVTDTIIHELLGEQFAYMRSQGIDPKKYMKNRQNAIDLLQDVYQQAVQIVTLDFLKDLASGELERREREKQAAAEAKDAEEPAMAEEATPSGAETQGETAQQAQVAEEEAN
ncbi:MAG: hypothetical protein ACK8QZ_03765, partial [Anaerolineales bacterium]